VLPRERWPSLADGIYAIVDTAVTAEPVAFGRGLVAGGIRVVQLRAKRGVDPVQLRGLVECAHAAGAIVIVNDDVEAARFADGIHLGQEDAALLDFPALRLALGGKVVGLSCGTPPEAEAANRAGVDYVGVGPMFATLTKDDAGDPIGIEGVAAVVRASRVPVVAIGGIDASRLADVRASGATMAAMISALAAQDVAARARELVALWAVGR
jgi:thiamine-phosphate pyrophosphorylase